MMYLAMVLAALVPVFLAYAVRWWLGRDYLQPIWTYPVLMLAGGAGGALFGIFGSGALESWFLSLSNEGDPIVLSVVVVPLAEETGKALILLLFLLTAWYRSALDGVLFGFAAGAGFAACENLLFFATAHAAGMPGDWAVLAAARVVPSTLVHGGATAIVGGYLGAARWERRPLVVFATVPAALLVATIVHGGWNGLMEIAVTEDGATHALLALGLLPVLVGILLVLLRAAHRVDKAMIRSELEPVVREGLMTPWDLEAVLDRRQRRSTVGAVYQRLAVGLAFALRSLRIERTGARRVGRLRRLLARLHPNAGGVSLPEDGAEPQ